MSVISSLLCGDMDVPLTIGSPRNRQPSTDFRRGGVDRDRDAVERGVARDVEPLGVGEVVDRDPGDRGRAAIRVPGCWWP